MYLIIKNSLLIFICDDNLFIFIFSNLLDLILFWICLLSTFVIYFRVNPEKTRYTGVICGLGQDEDTGCPIYPEHDIEIEFDANIGYEDIMKVFDFSLDVIFLKTFYDCFFSLYLFN